MDSFYVTFTQNVTTCDEQSMIIKAATAWEAGEKVKHWGETGEGLSDEEVATGKTVKEGEVVATSFVEFSCARFITPSWPVGERVDKDIFIDAILGRTPPDHMFSEFEKLECGHYTGGHLDRWTWDSSARNNLNNHDVVFVKDLYFRVKSS